MELGRRFTGPGPVEVRSLCPGPSPVSRDAAQVFAVGRIVLKVHWPGTAPGPLAARLRLAADPRLHDVLLGPVHPEPLPLADRWVTVWPLAEPLPDTLGPFDVPWEAVARLLAGLHAHPVPDPAQLPGSGQVERVERTMDDLLGTCGGPDGPSGPPQVPTVLAAWERVRDEGPGPVRAVTHGDWHFGQVVRPPGAADGWRLIDIDDLGWGDPTWDLGRAAAFHLLGVVPRGPWRVLVSAYRDAGGLALPDDDLWRHLERGARAHVVHAAARALIRHRLTGDHPDDLDRELLRACDRMLVD